MGQANFNILDHLSTAASLSPCRKSLPPVKASVRRQPNDHMSAGVEGFGGVLKEEVGWKPDRRRTFLQSWVSPPSSFSSPSPLLPPRLLLSSLLLSSVSPSQESREEHWDLSELSWQQKDRVWPASDKACQPGKRYHWTGSHNGANFQFQSLFLPYLPFSNHPPPPLLEVLCSPLEQFLFPRSPSLYPLSPHSLVIALSTWD